MLFGAARTVNSKNSMNTASTVFQEASLFFQNPTTEFTAFLKFPVGQARLTKELDFFASENQFAASLSKAKARL